MGMFTCLIFSIVFVGFNNARAQECPPRMNCALRLTCGARPSITSVFNVQTKMGVVIDTDNDMSLVFDGSTGVQLLYDHKRSAGIRITRHTGAWTVSQSTIVQYVQSIRSLKDTEVYEESTFQINAAPDEIISTHRRIVRSLEPEMSDFAEYKKTDILSISVNLFDELCKIRKKRLRNFFDRKFRMKSYYVYGGLINVISVFRGLSSMIQETQGSIERHILKPSFDLQPIFKAECGSESLALIVDQINRREVRVWQNMRHPSVLYKIIREFDGGLYKGLRGVETLVFHLIQFSQNRLSLEVLIDVLIQVTASIKQASYPVIIQKVKFIQKIIMTRLSPSISQQVSVYFNSFMEDKLVINNVNIGTIVKTYLVGSSFGLPNVVGVLHNMRTHFYGSLSVLLNRMSFFIMSGQAPFYILRLMPNLRSSLDLEVGIPPIQQITKALTPQLFREFSDENFEVTMSSIPVLGAMFTEISRTLPVVHEQKELWISEMTRADSYESVFGWLKFAMGMQGGVKPAGCVHEMGLWGLDRSGCTCWD